MQWIEAPLAGAFIITPTRHEDERGYFARLFCAKTFQERGLVSHMVQTNLSYNPYAGTLRGMHYQEHPHAEVKLVRCTQGAIFDVIVDVREDSSTYLQWYGIELTQNNAKALYVPQGFAHGYQTLADCSEVMYQVSEFYAPQAEKGVHHADPKVGIIWPLPVTNVSLKDDEIPFLD